LPVRTADININDNNIDLEKILVVLFAIVYQSIRIILVDICVCARDRGAQSPIDRDMIGFGYTNNYRLSVIDLEQCVAAQKFTFTKLSLNWPECGLFQPTRTAVIH